MKIVIEASLAMLFSISTFAVEHGVESVHTVFVKGNNRVAVSLRKEFIKRFEGSKRKGMESCFKLVSKARAAGAVLEVTQDSNNRRATANLTSKSGEWLWSDEYGTDGTKIYPVAEGLWMKLAKAARCKGGGR